MIKLLTMKMKLVKKSTTADEDDDGGNGRGDDCHQDTTRCCGSENVFAGVICVYRLRAVLCHRGHFVCSGELCMFCWCVCAFDV